MSVSKRLKPSEETKVNGIICPVCKDGIYSVARHDFHYCSCGATFIDGGFDYIRTGSSVAYERLQSFTIYVPASMTELYEDYKNETTKAARKWGTLDRDALRKLLNSGSAKSVAMVAPATRGASKAIQRKGRA